MGLGWRLKVRMIASGIVASMQDPNGYIMYDRLNDVNGTQMISHPMIKDSAGVGWSMGTFIGTTLPAASATIQSNVLKFTSDSSMVITGLTFGNADPTIEVEWKPNGTTDRNSIVTRYLDGNNLTLVNFRAATNNDIQIVRVVGGVPQVVPAFATAPFAWVIGTTYKITVTHNISLIAASIDGVPKVNDSTLASPSVVGLMRNTGDNASELNNFTVK